MSMRYERVCDICGRAMAQPWTTIYWQGSDDSDICKDCTSILNKELKELKKAEVGKKTADEVGKKAADEGLRMNFGDVIKAMEEDLKDRPGVCDTRPMFACRGWNGKGMYITAWRCVPGLPLISRSCIFIRDVEGYLVPWTASQTDMLADDWYEVTERCTSTSRARTPAS